MAAEQEAHAGTGSTSLIQEGDQVVLRMDKALKIVQVRKNRKIFFEKLNFDIDGAINSPYGSVFEVKEDQLNLIKPGEDVDDLQATSTEDGDKSSEYQPIKSDGQSQKLTRDDVDALKSQGVSGQEIVKQLVENSETFKDRTEFSQAKYKNKKNKKYNAKITILKPTTRLIASTFYSRMSYKICELRPDSLSQLLSLANVRANSKVIVVEQCQGLVVGAVLDRMGGCGNIVQIHSGDFPNRLAMECYGFSSSFMEQVSAFPLNKVNSLKVQQKEGINPSQTVGDIGEEKMEKDETKQQRPEMSSKPSEEQRQDTSFTETVADKGKETKTYVEGMDEQPPATSSEPSKEQRDEDATIEKIMDETKQQPSVSSSKASDEQSLEAEIKEQERIKRRNQRQLEERNARNALLSRNMDSLVVVCKLDPSNIVLGLLDYVAPSRPFVIFSTFKELLVECYADLKNRGGVVNLKLTETWWREYQVLPGRTHPLVNMDGSGGYLLFGTTVERPAKTDSTKMDNQDKSTEVPQTPRSCGEKHGPSQTQEDKDSEPPAKKPREQKGTASVQRTEVPVTRSKVTVIASKVQDKSGETPGKKWRQRGKRGGKKITTKAGNSVTPASEGSAVPTRKEETGKTQPVTAKKKAETPHKRAGNPVTPPLKAKASASQVVQGKTGQQPAKKRQRGKRSGNKAVKKSEINVRPLFPPPSSIPQPLLHPNPHPYSHPPSHPHSHPNPYSHPHPNSNPNSHPFSPPPLLSLFPRPPRPRPFQFHY